jgi:Tfp pilus assembly protein PilO
MKVQMTSTNRLIAAILVVVVLATAFWMMLLSPKREEAKKLGAQVETLEASLARHEAEAAEAEAAREEFPTEYQRLVVLGKAVPGDDDVASLFVQLNRISDGAGGTFREIKLTPGSEGSETPAIAPAATSAEATPVSATEVSASLLPLGATIGPAGLAVMPYNVAFDGNFFDVADFIKGLDSLVKTGDDEVRVDGRLVTIDGFSLEADPVEGFPALQASFSLTTYLTPPSEGITGGATPETPGATTVTPAATTTGGAP